MVRQTNDGLSMTMDYQGNVLAAMDHFTARDHVMISQVPTQGASTIYGHIGDLFAWLWLAASAVMTGRAVAARREFEGHAQN